MEINRYLCILVTTYIETLQAMLAEHEELDERLEKSAYGSSFHRAVVRRLISLKVRLPRWKKIYTSYDWELEKTLSKPMVDYVRDEFKHLNYIEQLFEFARDNQHLAPNCEDCYAELESWAAAKS